MSLSPDQLAATNLFGDNYEEEAIEFICQYEPPEGYFVGFSGGKDSVVVLDLVRRAGVKHEVWYSATGIDPPELVKFIREYYPDVRWARPKESFFRLIPKKGYPTRLSRWCCDSLKKVPTKDVPLFHRIMGIRAEESSARAKRERIDLYKRPKKQVVYKPIFCWLEWQIWQYIKDHNLPVCDLYDEGFDRLGCVICPFLNHGRENPKLKQHMERWPKIYKAFERAMLKRWREKDSLLPKWGGFSFGEFLDYWYSSLSPKQRETEPLLWGPEL